jgi:hypothetical protein
MAWASEGKAGWGNAIQSTLQSSAILDVVRAKEIRLVFERRRIDYKLSQLLDERNHVPVSDDNRPGRTIDVTVSRVHVMVLRPYQPAAIDIPVEPDISKDLEGLFTTIANPDQYPSLASE